MFLRSSLNSMYRNVLWIALSGMALEVNAAALNFRKLSEAASRTLCSESIDFRDLWAHGVFDAQVEGTHVTPIGSSRATSKHLKDRAQSLASEFSYRGYSYGSCGDGSGWVVGFPSSKGISISRRNVKIVSQNECVGALRVQWSADKGGLSTPLAFKDGKYLLPENRAGFLSVECMPNSGVSTVPQEWYLAPFGHPRIEVPKARNLDGLNDQEKFLSWVNAVRTMERLTDVARESNLDESARLLSLSKLVQHDAKKLIEQERSLFQKGLRLIGEDRVRASTLEDAALLLWMSPKHRDLLLHRELDHVGIFVEHSDRGVFVTILGARKIELAKNP